MHNEILIKAPGQALSYLSSMSVKWFYYLQTYVQDLLKKNANEVIELLMESQAQFYVCGDISMAADVYRTLEVSWPLGPTQIDTSA